jgi:hypothetical protein
LTLQPAPTKPPCAHQPERLYPSIPAAIVLSSLIYSLNYQTQRKSMRGEGGRRRQRIWLTLFDTTAGTHQTTLAPINPSVNIRRYKHRSLREVRFTPRTTHCRRYRRGGGRSTASTFLVTWLTLQPPGTHHQSTNTRGTHQPERQYPSIPAPIASESPVYSPNYQLQEISTRWWGR